MRQRIGCIYFVGAKKRADSERCARPVGLLIDNVIERNRDAHLWRRCNEIRGSWQRIPETVRYRPGSSDLDDTSSAELNHSVNWPSQTSASHSSLQSLHYWPLRKGCGFVDHTFSASSLHFLVDRRTSMSMNRVPSLRYDAIRNTLRVYSQFSRQHETMTNEKVRCCRPTVHHQHI